MVGKWSGLLYGIAFSGLLSASEGIFADSYERTELKGDYQAFDRFYRNSATPLSKVTAEWVTGQGVILHDGKCSYQPDGSTDCFDPTQSEDALGCSRPKMSPFGTHWLYLHHAIQTKNGEERQRWDLPLWAWDHIWQPGEGAYYIWGAGKESKVQELWRLQPDGTKAKVFTGPAELSGGIAPLPERPSCLALTTYALADEICGGTSTIWQWCPKATELTKLHSFKGCSGRLAVTNERFLIGPTDDLRSFHRSTLVEETVKVSEAVIGHGVLPDGRLFLVRWNGRRVRVFAIGKAPVQKPKNAGNGAAGTVKVDSGNAGVMEATENTVFANKPRDLKLLELR